MLALLDPTTAVMAIRIADTAKFQVEVTGQFIMMPAIPAMK
jgi:hypothetical protein|tara:strand:+ start:985 stop:1107 length:123 start_codon:yes stop_codon:yes gene_type:complete